MAKSLIRLCASLKTLSNSAKYLGTARLHQSQNETQDLAIVNNNKPSEAKKLFDLFTNEKNPISLIVNIEENKDKIDGRHVVTAMTSMYKFYEMNNYPLENVINSPQFTAMCNHLNRHVRTMEMPHIIQALKILNLFKIRSSTTVIQNLLQMIRVSVNELHPHEIYYLTFLLKRMNPTYLGNAIYTALPEVFETRIKTKLDVEDLVELTDALRFAINYTKNNELIKFLMEKIGEYDGPIDTNAAIKIFQSLCRSRNLANYFNDILLKIRDVIVRNIDNLNKNEVKLITSDMCTQVFYGYGGFYDPLLLDLLINKLIKDDYGVELGFHILAKINHIGHIHLALLKYLTSNPQNIINSFSKVPKIMTVLAQGLANSNYKPSNWEDIRDSIFQNFKRLPDHVTMAYLALYLASLDDCNFSMIEEVFTKDRNPDLLKQDYRQTLCELYQIIKTLYPEYVGPWPMDEILQSFPTLQFENDSTDYPLTPALNVLFGDPTFVKTNVRTNLGHKIDYLVVLQNGSPIAIESNVTSEDLNSSCFVADLDIPKDCVKIAICLIPSQAYSRNIAVPNAKIRIKRKTLKAMGFKVVFLSEDTWISTPDRERLPYLRHLIGLEKKTQGDKDVNENHSDQLLEASR